MADCASALQLPALTDADKLDLFKRSLLQFVQMRPSHGPRENREKPSQLSPSTRCAAWAVDVVKAAEYCWNGERAWRAQPKTGETSSAAPAAEGSSDVPW